MTKDIIHLDSAASVQVCRVEEQVSIVAKVRLATSAGDISARQSAVLSIGVAKDWELGKYKGSGAGMGLVCVHSHFFPEQKLQALRG